MFKITSNALKTGLSISSASKKSKAFFFQFFECGENVEMEEYVYVGGESEEVEEVEETSCDVTEMNKTVEVEYKSASSTVIAYNIVLVENNSAFFQ